MVYRFAQARGRVKGGDALVHDPTAKPPFHVMVPRYPGKHAHAAPGFLFELATLHENAYVGLVSWTSINACMTLMPGVHPV